MYPLGYLVLMANLQDLVTEGRHSDFQIGSFKTLQQEIESIPDMPLQGFGDSGFQRNGQLGVYISKNLRDYLFYGEGNEDDEGVLIKLYYKPQSRKAYNPNLMAYFLHRGTVEQDIKEKVIEFIFEYNNGRMNDRTMEENS